MGEIRLEVRDGYLQNHPEDEILLKPFLNGFFITYGTVRKAYNTEIKVFFLSPEDFIKEAYGFENEILLIYAPYPRMEPRTLQAIEQIFSESPAKGRVETLNYFLISDSTNIREWLNIYASSRQESRIIISFSKDELILNRGDPWFIRNRLNEQFFGRDLFNYSLPLVEDTYYFGRQQQLMEYLDSIKRRENKAIFGLRKTGKTSFIFKLKRMLEKENIAKSIYIDCKLPDIRKYHWNELLEDIAQQLATLYGFKIDQLFTDKNASKSFYSVVDQVRKVGGNFCLFFDEIEYISFISKINPHWQNEFIDFWQTLWSCQSQLKNFSFVISGVNPSVIENDRVSGVQNPLFGIVPHKYLTGFTQDEVKIMLKALGKRMGIQFDNESIESIFNWYGGHPLLTRLACSWFNTILSAKSNKPIRITKSVFENLRNKCDEELVFYCGHVVSELKEFYEFEYYMFELLVTGQQIDFNRAGDQYIKHLLNYGIVTSINGNYNISIPVIGKYVGNEVAKSEGRLLVYKIIDKERREPWLIRRKEEILNDIRVYESILKNNNLPKLFGQGSVPDSIDFSQVTVVNTKSDFSAFINICNKCFVESIENYGKLLNSPNYLWSTIKNNYPDFFDALLRIKVYRNEQDHLEVNSSINEYLLRYRKIDLEGYLPSQVPDFYFLLEQRILDSLLLAIQTEINKIS